MPTDPLGELVREQRSALVGVARREGLCAEDALECVQDALSTLLSRGEMAPPFDPARVAATLRVMVRNAARNARRKHSRARPHGELDDDAVVASDGGADELLERGEDVARLRACVDELSEVHRAVITLRLLDERSGEDVASALGLSRGYVDVLLHRAKAALGACMLCVG